MARSPYNVGQRVRLQADFERWVIGTPGYEAYDPAAVTLTVRKPDGSEVTVTLADDLQVVSVGTVVFELVVDQAGDWLHVWKAPNETVQSRSFQARAV